MMTIIKMTYQTKILYGKQHIIKNTHFRVMSSEAVSKIGKKALNRIIIGIEFMVIFGLVGGLAVYLLGVPLTGDVRDLGTGIEAIDENVGTGFAIMIWWLVSTLIIAGIAILIVAKWRMLVPFKQVEKAPDIPKKTFIITFVVLGAIISFLFWLANQFLGFFGTELSSVDIAKIGVALTEGDFTTLFVGLIFALIAGTILIAVVSATTRVQKAEEDIGLPKSAQV